MTRSLLVKPSRPATAGQMHQITPQSAGWQYVGSEVFDLLAGQKTLHVVRIHGHQGFKLRVRGAVRTGLQQLADAAHAFSQHG